ncbi:hypothetical protein ACF3NV_10415 (plasmid) [Moraxella atlantae]|uniref:hypothetical protein n=1 Tax=Faucicola atlantae TaxID=34059 RepID=UPI003750E750
MAEKDKIPQIGIEMIVKLKSDKYQNYSFKKIAEILAKELNINVTGQSVGYQYRKHKNDVILNTSAVSKNDESQINTISNNGDENSSSISASENNDTPNVVIRRNPANKENQRKEFIDTSEEDLKKFLQGE